MTKIPAITVPTARAIVALAFSIGALSGAAVGCSDDDKSGGATPGGNADGGGPSSTTDGGGTNTQTDGSTATDSGTPVTQSKFGLVSVTSSAASHSVFASFSNSV